MADTSYVIDIAANMPEGGLVASELDALSASLVEAGADADTFSAAAATVAQQIKAAQAATESANAALAEGNARYSELERAALNAAKAAERAGLKNGGVIPPGLAARVAETSAELDAHAFALQALEHDALAAAKAEAKLGEAQANLKRLTGAASKSFAEQEAAAKKSVREAEGMVPLVKQYNDFTDAISSSEGAAIIATGAAIGLAAAIAAVTAALIAGTIAVAAWAVGLGNARRDAALVEEASAALHPELAALSGEFASITEQTGASAQQLRGWKKQLDAAKVPAEDIPDALRAMALAEAALGQGGSAELLENLKETKDAIGDAAREAQKKLGGIVEKRMLGLDQQALRFKKNISDIFGNLNIEPALEGLRVLVDLFDKGSASGQAIRFLFETIFQPLIDGAADAAVVVEAFVLGFLIGLTRLYIGAKPYIKAIQEFFGFEDTALEDTLLSAKTAGELLVPVFIGIVFAITAAIAIVGFLVAQLFLLPAAAAAVVAGVVWMGMQVWEWVTGTFEKVSAFLDGLIPGFSDVGLNIVKGMINGITSGASGVIGAVIDVAKGAITAAKKALGIASPSTVFAELGGYTAEGFAVGVDDGAADAQAAMQAMVEPPAAGSVYAAAGQSGATASAERASAAGEARGGAAGGKMVNFNGPVYFGGKQATKGEIASLVEQITAVLEGDAAAIAGELAPA